jgi:peptidoglycan/LPS O-acetylase OafA/YrhL
VWLIGINAINIALLGLMLASPVLAVLCTHRLTALQNLLPYIPYLAAGALLATLLHGRESSFFGNYITLLPRRGLVLWALVIAAVVFAYLCNNYIWAEVSVPLDALLMPATVFFILLEATAHSGLLQQLLDAPLLRALGRVSYSVYLWQQLFLGPPDAYPEPWFWNQWPLNILAGICCGALGYLLIEKPCGRLRARYL